MKTTVQNVSTVVRAKVKKDLESLAGNGFLSRKEETKAPPFVQRAAAELRQANPGKWVSVSALEAKVANHAAKLIGEVNQAKGVGSTVVSLAEAKAAARKDASLGFVVLEAYQVVAGKGLDIEGLARQHAAPTLDEDSVFRTFTTEAQAMAAQDPDGKQIVWLVRTSEGVLANSYVSGRNDLWAQRFDIDKLTGAVTVTAEH